MNKWTVMVYLAGDNNLSEECVFALTEMKKAGISDDIEVFAQFDPRDDFLPTQRYQINRRGQGSEHGPLTEDIIDHVPFKKESSKCKPMRPLNGDRTVGEGESYTGDPAGLYNFIGYCVEFHPAEHYLVVVCGHGAGIQKDYLLKDESPDGYLTLCELRKVFKWVNENFTDAKGEQLVIDILGLDACLMSMAEICYELKGLVKVAVGSESYSPAAGWPYRQILGKLVAWSASQSNSQTTPDVPAQVARSIVDEYVAFYSDYWLGGLSVAQSALDVGKVDELKEKVKIFAECMTRELNNKVATEAFTAALVLAHWDSQSYNGELFVDLADFCNCLAKRYPNSEVAKVCEATSCFILQDFVLRSCYSGRKYQYSYGVSIYFPWDFVLPYYKPSLGFPSKSKWVDFLMEYTTATRRPPRDVTEKTDEVLWHLNLSGSKMGSDKMGSDKAPENPVHSMRNPPIVFRPNCLGEKDRNENEEGEISLLS
jgi:hypothetical protein